MNIVIIAILFLNIILIKSSQKELHESTTTNTNFLMNKTNVINSSIGNIIPLVLQQIIFNYLNEFEPSEIFELKRKESEERVNSLIENNNQIIFSNWYAVKLLDLKNKMCVDLTNYTDFCHRTRLITLIDKNKIAFCATYPTELFNLKTNIEVWNLETKKRIAMLAGHTNWINSLIKIDKNRIASSCIDGKIKIWDLKKKKCSVVFVNPLNKKWMYLVKKISKDKIISYTSDGKIRIHNIETNKCIFKLELPTYFKSDVNTPFISGMVMLDENTIAALDNFIKIKMLQIWNLKNKKCLASFEILDDNHRTCEKGYIFKLDKNRIIYLGKSDIQIWDLKTQKCTETIKNLTAYSILQPWDKKLLFGTKKNIIDINNDAERFNSSLI